MPNGHFRGPEGPIFPSLKYNSMKFIQSVILALLSLIFFSMPVSGATDGAAKTVLGRPALDSIRNASCDPASPYYYPKLLKRFLANDTAMSSVDFQYFYYGTLFQEDYDPYRKPVHPGELEALATIYAKPEKNRSDRNKILDYARVAILDNPVDLQQLTNLIYVYELNGKYDLSKIWQYKLNQILKVIAKSGTGADAQNAWVVVYPRHEYDFLNLSGIVSTGHSFEEPAFDVLDGRPAKKNDATPQRYYFDIAPMLEQYYLKHPDEEE